MLLQKIPNWSLFSIYAPMYRGRLFSWYWLCLCLWCISQRSVVAQRAKQITQLSGLVVGGDSLFGIPGVLIHIPKAGRGTITNETGYFSIPCIAGDSVIVSAVGYKKQSLVVKFSEKQSQTVIIELKEDTIFLPVVEIFPYPTEELFKKAFLELNLSNQGQYNNMGANLDIQIMQRMIINSQMSANENQKYSLRNQMYGPVYGQGFQIFNPYAWKNVIRSFRKGDASKSAE